MCSLTQGHDAAAKEIFRMCNKANFTHGTRWFNGEQPLSKFIKDVAKKAGQYFTSSED